MTPRDRGIFFVVSLVAAVIAHSLRDPWITREKAALAEFQQLTQDAFRANSANLAEFDAGRSSPTDVASGLEQRALPLWKSAEDRLYVLRADGRRGAVFETLHEYVRARRIATELLIEAIREQDSRKQSESRVAWQRAEHLEGTMRSRLEAGSLPMPTIGH